MFENLADHFGVIDQRDDLHRRAALGTLGIGLVDLVDQSRPRRPGARGRHGEDVLPVRYGRKNVFLDPIPIGEHALLVTARAEIPRLARKREQVIVTAFGAIHARESVVRVAAFEEALDDAFFEQPLQAPLGSQFGQVAIGALIEETRARLTLVIHAAFGRPARRSRAWLAGSLQDAINAATLARGD